MTWENRTIAEVLALSVDEAKALFQDIPTLASPLKLMQELGLGYLTLGQPFNTLSGGEVQRLKLVSDLTTKTPLTTLYIMDEPSAGLHFEDIHKLIAILHRLVDKGHSILVIEHHLDLLQQCDWLMSLAPKEALKAASSFSKAPPPNCAKPPLPPALPSDKFEKRFNAKSSENSIQAPLAAPFFLRVLAPLRLCV